MLVYNNERIYFYNKETKSILDDNSEVIRNVWYGQSYCDNYDKHHGENIECEDTFDIFELFLHDSGKLLLVNKDGYIFHTEKEEDFDKKIWKI